MDRRQGRRKRAPQIENYRSVKSASDGLKSSGLRVAKDAAVAFKEYSVLHGNHKSQHIIRSAASNAQLNGRKTIKVRDVEVAIAAASC